MAEETRNASKSAAFGIVGTCLVTAVVGLAYTLGLLYSIPSPLGISGTLAAVPTNGVAALFVVVTGNNSGLILTNVIVANLFFAGLFPRPARCLIL